MKLDRRVSALEAGDSGRRLSAVVRQWLGLPVTEAELAASSEDDEAIDTTAFPQEVKAWLGVA